MAAPAFHPTHPVAKFRVLKQPWREYLASGNATGVDINTIANQLATAPTTVAGIVYKDLSVPAFPAQVSVQLYLGASLEQARFTPVTPATGAYTTTFPANSLPAGTCHATVSGTGVTSKSSNTFTVT